MEAEGRKKKTTDENWGKLLVPCALLTAEPDVHCMADCDGDGDGLPATGRTARSLSRTQTPCGALSRRSLTPLKPLSLVAGAFLLLSRDKIINW